jgi:hypothetical protein
LNGAFELDGIVYLSFLRRSYFTVVAVGRVSNAVCGTILGGSMRFRYSAGLACCCLAFFSALAAPDDDSGGAIAACAALKDRDARLACFDALSGALKPAATPPPVPAIVPPPAAPAFVALPPPKPAPATAQTTPEVFGSESLPAEASPDAAPPLDSISAAVAKVSFGPTGRFTVVLDNGQVWQQLTGDTDKARFPSDTVMVTISRGLIGSYNLSIGDSAKTFKVRRIK